MKKICFLCPTCNQVLNTPENMWGETIQCPACGNNIKIPNKGEKSAVLVNQKPFIKGKTKRCPSCGETILKIAKKCKHCHEYLDPQDEKPEQSDVQEKNFKVCRYCKKKIDGESNYCFYCGRKTTSPITTLAIIFWSFVILSIVIFFASLDKNTASTSEKYTLTFNGKKVFDALPDKSFAIAAAQSLIEEELIAPRSAKHPRWSYEPSVKCCEGVMIWEVVSYVDAENSYGAFIRLNYAILIEFYYDKRGRLNYKKLKLTTW